MAAKATVELAVDESGGVGGFTRFERAGVESFGKVKAAAATVTDETKKAAAATDALATSSKKAGEALAAEGASAAGVAEKTAAAAESAETLAAASKISAETLSTGATQAAAMAVEVKATAVAADVLTASVAKAAEAMKVAQVASTATAQSVRVAPIAPPAPAPVRRPQTGIPAVEAELVVAAKAAEQLGEAGEKAGRKIASGQDEAKGHTLSSLDSVRLMRDDLGVRIPRAMEKLISSTEAFQKVAAVAFNAFALIGVLELVGAIGDKLSDWAHILTGDTKAVQELRKALVEANEARMTNPNNSDAATQSRQELQATLKMLELRKEMNSVSRIPDWILGNTLGGGGNTVEEKSALKHWTPEMDQELIKTRQLLGDLNENNAKREDSWNEHNASQLRANTEIQLEGYRKIAQAAANARAVVQDKTLGINGQSKTLTPAQAQTENGLIDQKAAAEYAVLSRKYADEVRNAWQASAVARVQGEQRAYLQMSDAVKNFEIQAKRDGRPDAEIYGEETAMWSKYLYEKAERQRQFTDETIRMTEQTRMIEAEGVQRLFVEEMNSMQELARERISSGRQAAEFDQEYADRRVAIQTRMYAEIERSVREYVEQGRRSHEELIVSESKGYARIDAEQTRRLDDAAKQYTEHVAGLQWDDKNYLDATAAYERQKLDIYKAGYDQRKDLHQRNLDETQAIRDEAASTHSSGGGFFGMLAEEQAQTAKINAEYDKRRQHLREALDANVVSQREADDQASAIEDLHTAQLDAQYRSMREKIAGSIESGFKDPLGAIKSAMQRQMAEIIADWIMQLGVFKTMFGNSMTGGSSSHAGSGGGLLGAIMHRGGGTAATATAGGGAGTYSPAIASSSTTASLGGFGGSSNTLSQAAAAPHGGIAGTSMSPTTAISDAMDLSHTGMSAVQALQKPSVAGLALDDDAAWNDPSKMSSSDSFSDAYHVNADQEESGTASGANAALGVAGAAMGTYTGVTGMISAFESGKASGILSGAMSGATMGASIGMLAGPMGAAIGAGVGAVGGATAGMVGWASGEGGRIQGQKYFKDTLQPQMEETEKSYTSGQGGDALSAISAVNAEAMQGYSYLYRTIGGSAAAWTRDAYITKEREKITGDINRMARSGRDYTAMTAAEFHDGGPITGFGDWATSSNEGMIHALLDETVMNRAASSAHGPTLSAMNSGASPAEIAGHYLSMMQPQTMTATPATVTHKHDWTVHAIDADSFERLLAKGGGAEIVHRSLNNYINENASEGYS